jgi:hypothetical protein
MISPRTNLAGYVSCLIDLAEEAYYRSDDSQLTPHDLVVCTELDIIADFYACHHFTYLHSEKLVNKLEAMQPVLPTYLSTSPEVIFFNRDVAMRVLNSVSLLN